MRLIKRLVRNLIDSCVWFVCGVLQADRLPTFFNRKLIWVEPEMWHSVFRVYEPHVAVKLKTLLKKGGCFFDVGAHHGVWSLFAAKLVGKEGKVYAFEPSPAFHILNKYRRGKGRIKPLRMGIGRENGTAAFFDQGDSTSGSFVRSVTEINASYSPNIKIGSNDCAIRSLDSVVDELGVVPEVVKMDIEGFEVEALHGAKKLLDSKMCTWIVEVHPLQLERSGSSTKEVFRLFEEKGYRVESIDAPANMPETIVAYPA